MFSSLLATGSRLVVGDSAATAFVNSAATLTAPRAQLRTRLHRDIAHFLSHSLSFEQGFVRLSLCHEQLSVWRTARVCCCSLLIRSTALPIINTSRATGQRFFDCCCQRRSRKRKIWRDPMTRMCGDPLWQSSCTSYPINTTTSSHFTLHTALSLSLSRSGFIFQLKSCLFRWRAYQARYRGFLILHTHTHRLISLYTVQYIAGMVVAT